MINTAQMVRKIALTFFATHLIPDACGALSQSNDVCLPGVSTQGCSQLQISLGAGHPFRSGQDTAVGSLKKATISNEDNVSLVELDEDLSLYSGVRLAETFLKGASDVELALAALDEHMSPTTQELTSEIMKLSEDQGASPIGCKARITEVKVTLKQLHADVLTTATYLKETKKEVQVVDTQLKQVLVSIKKVDKVKIKALKICEKKKATDKMMLTKLMGDMQEMRQMGRTVTTVRTRTVKKTSKVSLLGLPANASSDASAAHVDRTGEVQDLIGNARAASLQMRDCLKAHAPASLLAENSSDTTAAALELEDLEDGNDEGDDEDKDDEGDDEDEDEDDDEGDDDDEDDDNEEGEEGQVAATASKAGELQVSSADSPEKKKKKKKKKQGKKKAGGSKKKRKAQPRAAGDSNVEVWDCTGGEAWHTSPVQLLVEGNGADLKALDVESGTYTQGQRIEFSWSDPPLKDINGCGMNANDSMLYCAVKVGGKWFIARIGKTKLRFVGKLPTTSTGYWATSFGPEGDCFTIDNVKGSGGRLFTLPGLDHAPGFASSTDPSLTDLSELSPFADPNLPSVADIVVVHADFEKTGSQHRFVLSIAGSSLIVIRVDEEPYKAWKIPLSGLGGSGAFGAAWNFLNQIYFSRNDGSGVFQVDLDSIDLSVSSPSARASKAGSSTATKRNDGFNCPMVPPPWTTTGAPKPVVDPPEPDPEEPEPRPKPVIDPPAPDPEEPEPRPIIVTDPPVRPHPDPIEPETRPVRPHPDPIEPETQPIIVTDPPVRPHPDPFEPETRPIIVTDPPVQPEPQISLPDPNRPTLETEPDHCKIERETLTETWTEAYEEVTREVESYQILVDDTSCFDSAESEYQEQFQPLQVSETELSYKVSVFISKVQVLKPQLQSLKKARKKLKKRLKVIEMECKELEKTKETLEVTKEVIIKMDECAGLDSSAFKLPVWAGQWISMELSEDLSVFDTDARMDRACSDTFGDDARAAETSEIDTRAIRKMPKRNKAPFPVMPKCPMCGSRLSRVCWESGAKFNRKKRRDDCTPGMRAILCVKTGRSKAPEPELRIAS